MPRQDPANVLHKEPAGSCSLPLVSVITPSYNMVKFLPDTIESVLTQDYPNIEYLVVDGGSTDGSLDILECYRNRLRYVSGPDHGPSDAIRKGFRQAKGEILAWLNADDTYCPRAVSAAAEYLRLNPAIDIVYGEGWWIDEGGGVISRYPTMPFDAKLFERDCFICQPAAFVRASAYFQCELDPTVNPSFDYDLWIRLAKTGFQFAHIPQYLANSRLHREAMTVKDRLRIFQSSMDVLKRHFAYVPFSWVFGYTAYRIDGRDQIFSPLKPSVWKYLASLPVGLRYNLHKPARFVVDWAAVPVRSALRGIRSKRRPSEDPGG